MSLSHRDLYVPALACVLNNAVKSLERDAGVLVEIQSTRAPLASRGRLRPGGYPLNRRGRTWKWIDES